jgi:uncharacterized protein
VLVYLDSNIVIYLIEQPAVYGPLAAAKVKDVLDAGDRIVVSDLTRIECRCTPLAANDTATLALFDAFFERIPEQVAFLTTAVCDRATLIRAQYRYKTPDALHLAAACEAGCGLFLTKDSRLSGFSDMSIEILQ